MGHIEPGDIDASIQKFFQFFGGTGGQANRGNDFDLAHRVGLRVKVRNERKKRS